MLGESIEDPDGVEGLAGSVPGLGYLPVTTLLSAEKRVVNVSGISLRDGQPFLGYEIHVGQTRATAPVQPLLRIEGGQEDGAISGDGRVAGCYVHRLFDHPAQRGAWLAWLGGQSDGLLQEHRVDQALDALAAALEEHVDIPQLLALAGLVP